MKEKDSFDVFFFCVCIVLMALLLTGCASAGKEVAKNAGSKNVNADGYVMLGKIETANAETITPQGVMIIGRVNYKSRKVAVPVDQKVPTAGYFKATKTKSLFGTEETIIEYDFTAGSDADAKAALAEYEKRTNKVVTAFEKK